MSAGKIEVFYSNICVVCQSTSRETELKKCSKCRMISYCSWSHQKQHWGTHKKICSIINRVKLLTLGNNPEGEKIFREGVLIHTKPDWYNYRTKFMLMCELLNGSKLNKNEVNMILFPKTCEVCHAIDNLQNCDTCLCVSYCSEGHKNVDAEFHKSICDSLKLGFDMDIYLSNNGSYPDYYWKEIVMLTTSMRSFVEENIKFKEVTNETLKHSVISELITCPLTMVYSLSKMEAVLENEITIHVVGAGLFETNDLQGWELILHLTNITTLKLCFVGPEIEEMDLDEVNLCEDCCRRRKKLLIDFKQMFYHTYCESKDYIKPSYICLFNCGLHEYEDCENDTWKDSLKHLVEHKVPIVLTSFTEAEAKKDISRILSLRSDFIKKLNCVRNPFGSLRPYRDFENLGVFFNNQYISILVFR